MMDVIGCVSKGSVGITYDNTYKDIILTKWNYKAEAIRVVAEFCKKRGIDRFIVTAKDLHGIDVEKYYGICDKCGSIYIPGQECDTCTHYLELDSLVYNYEYEYEPDHMYDSLEKAIESVS